MLCQICGLHHEFKCSLIKAYDYYPDGTVKRVEFVTFADIKPVTDRQPMLTLPEHGTKQ